MLRARFKERGWEKYTGPFCGMNFVDGVTVDEVTKKEISMAANILSVEAFDDEKEDLPAVNLSHSQELVDQRQAVAAEPQKSVRVSEVKKEYTEESLGKLADDGGIAKLREVADKFGVKGKSISDLIKGILKAQG